MSLADLHTHTNFSDGELSPIEIINEAIDKKIKYLSITDHDTLSGYKKARKIINDSYANQILLIPHFRLNTCQIVLKVTIIQKLHPYIMELFQLTFYQLSQHQLHVSQNFYLDLQV